MTEVRWMRKGLKDQTHAFLQIDLAVGFTMIEPVGPCGRFKVGRLLEDDQAQRCPACVLALLLRSHS